MFVARGSIPGVPDRHDLLAEEQRTADQGGMDPRVRCDGRRVLSKSPVVLDALGHWLGCGTDN